MVSPAKVLVIGLDSADPNLLLKWCDSGDLPILQSLREKGVCDKLTSPPAMGDDATWASFFTTLSPARHGRYHWNQFQSGSYSTRMLRDEDLEYESFWDVLSRAGRKVAVLDVPKSPLSKNLNGFQLADWLVLGRIHDTCSFPPDLAATVLTSFGDNETESLCYMKTLTDKEYELLYQRLLDSIDRKLAAATQFLSQGNWDLFLTVFQESHCAGHQFWHFHDEQHLLYDAAIAKTFDNPLKRIYQALDTAIGKLLTLVGTETNVIVFSDLGMGANYIIDEPFLDEILLRLESPVLPPQWQPLDRLKKRLVRKIPTKLFRNQSLPPQAHRRAFQLEYNEIIGAIRINLKGREPNGRVRPGKELEELCTSLSRDLTDLINPDTGKPIVDRVLRTNLLLDGEYHDCLPDLLVVWKRDAPITAVSSPKIGEIRIKTLPYRTGNHLSDGIYFGCGPSVTVEKQPCSASIMDIGPTIAAWLNTSLPNTEGKPIAALFLPQG